MHRYDLLIYFETDARDSRGSLVETIASLTRVPLRIYRREKDFNVRVLDISPHNIRYVATSFSLKHSDVDALRSFVGSLVTRDEKGPTGVIYTFAPKNTGLCVFYIVRASSTTRARSQGHTCDSPRTTRAGVRI